MSVADDVVNSGTNDVAQLRVKLPVSIFMPPSALFDEKGMLLVGGALDDLDTQSEGSCFPPKYDSHVHDRRVFDYWSHKTERSVH